MLMIKCTVNGIVLNLHTENSLFSPNHIDKGTLAMLMNVDFWQGQKILDLGCGYGVVGIYAAHFAGAEHVTMVDVDPIAVAFAKGMPYITVYRIFLSFRAIGFLISRNGILI